MTAINETTVLRFAEPIGPQVLDHLRQAIIQAVLRPGQALSEKEVASRYGISRQPVREAFIKLAETGLVQVLPSRGTYVTKISVRDVLDARFVREAIECAIVREAARLMTDAHAASLAQNIAQQHAAVANRDVALFYRLDEMFHRSIGAIADCPQALRVIEQARAKIDRVRFLSLPFATPIEKLVRQHEDILEGLRRSDADAAEEAMRVHLREILSALPKLKETHADLFDSSEAPRHTPG